VTTEEATQIKALERENAQDLKAASHQ